MYVSILTIFYLILKLNIKIDAINKNITKIVQGIAINNTDDKYIEYSNKYNNEQNNNEQNG